MAIVAAGVAAIAAVEAAEVLRAGGEVALGGGAQYIRDGQPIGAIAQLGQELARVACRRYGSRPGDYPSDTALNYEKACRPYLDSLDPGGGLELIQDLVGGQCVGVPYAVTLKFWRCSDGADFGQQVQVLTGPIEIRRSGLQKLPPGSPPCADGQTFFPGKALYSNGNPISSWGGGCCARESVEVLSIVRQDGLPDDCGSQPPTVVQPEPPPVPLPPIVPIVIAPEVNINADVEVNIDGTINIDIGTGPITIDPFGGESDSGSGGGGGPDDSPPSPEPGPELPGGNGGFGGDDMFGDPPTGRRWVGACITITSKPVNQPPIPNSVPEDVYASVVGNIRLVYSASGTRQTDTPVRIQAKKVCVWEAVRKLNPVGVSVDLQAGFGYVYRPYSVPLDA